MGHCREEIKNAPFSPVKFIMGGLAAIYTRY